MLTKQKSKTIKLVKFLAIIPLVVGMLFYVSCNKLNAQEVDTNSITAEVQVYKAIIGIYKKTMSLSTDEVTDIEYVNFRKQLEKYVYANQNLIQKANFKKYNNFQNLAKEYDIPKAELDMFWELEHTVVALIQSVEANFRLGDNKWLLKKSGFFERLNYKMSNEDKWFEVYYKAKENGKEFFDDDFFFGPMSNKMKPFSSVDKPPIFPGCEESLENEELKKCFTEKISKHIIKEFNINIAKKLGVKGVQKIIARFRINENGDVTNIDVKSEHEVFSKEAKRVIKLLPEMKSGMHHDRPVTVAYALPIQFKVE